MDDRTFELIKETIINHNAISAVFLQKKLRITAHQANELVREFFFSCGILPKDKICWEKIHKQYINYMNFMHKARVENIYRIYKTSRASMLKMNKRNSMIVVLGGIKGGVGKSTLAINLATILSSEQKKVLLIDADQQGSLSDFVEHRQSLKIPTPWTTVKLSGIQVARETEKMKNDYDEIIIDAGGGDTSSHRAAMNIANVLIAPFKPGFFDINTLDVFEKIVELIMPSNPKLKIFALLNQADCKGITNEQGIQILKERKFLTCLNTIIKHRVSIRNSLSDGLTITEINPREPKAYSEIMSFYNEIYGDNNNASQKQS